LPDGIRLMALRFAFFRKAVSDFFGLLMHFYSIYLYPTYLCFKKGLIEIENGFEIVGFYGQIWIQF
jgi:hypothetical protein